MSYTTELELTEFATARGITLTSSTLVLLTKANDWIETQRYMGDKTDPAQTTQFPRKNIIIDGQEIDSATVPQAIKNAEMQLAIELDKGNDPYATLQPTVIREKIGDLETEYSDAPNAVTQTVINSVTPWLKGYLKSTGLRIIAG